jgi:hypothetical protein
MPRPDDSDIKIKTDEDFIDVRNTLPTPDKSKQDITDALLQDQLNRLKAKNKIEELQRVKNQEYLIPQKTEAERDIEENQRLERLKKLTAGTSNTRNYANVQFTPPQVSYLVNLLQAQANIHTLPVAEECLVKLESARIRM